MTRIGAPFLLPTGFKKGVDMYGNSSPLAGHVPTSHAPRQQVKSNPKNRQSHGGGPGKGLPSNFGQVLNDRDQSEDTSGSDSTQLPAEHVSRLDTTFADIDAALAENAASAA
jgi:hypothetical protein